MHFFDGKEDRNDIVYLLDYANPDNNDFHVVNQWTFVEYSEKNPREKNVSIAIIGALNVGAIKMFVLQLFH